MQLELVWPISFVQAMPVSDCQIENLMHQKRWKVSISIWEEKKIPLIALPKKDLIHWIKVSPQSILLTVVPVSKVDFVREFISTKNSST